MKNKICQLSIPLLKHRFTSRFLANTFVIFFNLQILLANNLHIENVRIVNRDTINNSADILFDIEWEHSWRISDEPANYDAAWVFFKFNEGADWKHITLDTTLRAVPENCSLNIADDGRGLMISRANNGEGTISFTNILLKWKYDGSLENEVATIAIKAFGIEMVYINAGPFYLGSGGTGKGEFKKGSSESTPYFVSDEDTLIIKDGKNGLWNNTYNENSTIGEEGILPPAFPKGVNAMYCMKYELSQQQYVEFLNTLTNEQIAERRNDTSETIYGNTISYDGEKFIASSPERACAYISWADDAAYSDWAGLRPMTELEFEKICRGTEFPIPNQFAWGDTNVRTDPYTDFINAGAANEIFAGMLPDVGNATYHETTFGFFDRPYRCGLFADGAINKTRRETGGTYYGVMDMSGNLWERTINIAYEESRTFTATHGDGVLTPEGFANVLTWPDASAVGIGKRGGMWRHPVNQIYISDRQFGAIVENDRRRNSGYRAVISDIL